MSSYDPIDEALNTQSDIVKVDNSTKIEVSQKSDEILTMQSLLGLHLNYQRC